ncbi:MAG: Tad domain-containing protein [Armatimonadetes bacterium]|nr:Tad domain-containing protein [Armatimonadota bacterium]
MVCGRLKKREGVALVFLAICIFVLIGMVALVVDIGRLYAAKQRAQNVADASALAGGSYLDGTPDCKGEVTTEAEDVGTQNNNATQSWKVEPTGGGSPVTVSFPTSVLKADGTTVTVNEGDAVRVDCRVHVEYGFGKIFGLDGSSPSASAIVMVTPVTTITSPDLVPWVVPNTKIWNEENPLEPGEITTLKVCSTQDPDAFVGSGNFLAISYAGDSGGNDYRNRIMGTADPITLSVYDTLTAVDSKPGNMIGPTKQGMEYRITGDTWTYETWVQEGETTGVYPDTSRLVIVPIVEDLSGAGTGLTELTVVGFAAFFIDSYDPDTRIVEGRFVSATDIAGILKWGVGGFSTNTTITKPRLVS